MSVDLSIPVPVIRGLFGTRLETFQTQIRPDQIASVLGHDPRPENWKNLPTDVRKLYEYLQRKTNKARRTSVKDYINQRMSGDAFTVGAFHAISIGMTQTPTFESIPGTGHSDVGVLKLDLSSENLRLLLDGLSRFCGAADLVESNKEAANWFTFPVSLFAPSAEQKELSMQQLGQLFHDFNVLGAPVSSAHAMALDQSDPFITIASMVGKSDVVQRFGGMEVRAQSLGKKSTALVTQAMLVRFAYGATQGEILSNRLSVARPSFKTAQIAEKIEICRKFLDMLSQKMGDMRFADHSSIHLTSQGWQALGLILHDISVKLKDQIEPSYHEKILDDIARINWARSNPDWNGLIGELKDPNDPSSLHLSRGGRGTVLGIRNYIREKTLLKTVLGEATGEKAA